MQIYKLSIAGARVLYYEKHAKVKYTLSRNANLMDLFCFPPAGYSEMCFLLGIN